MIDLIINETLARPVVLWLREDEIQIIGLVIWTVVIISVLTFLDNFYVEDGEDDDATESAFKKEKKEEPADSALTKEKKET